MGLFNNSRETVRVCNNDEGVLVKLTTTPPPKPTSRQTPKRILLVEIFQGEINDVKTKFNNFMTNNSEDIEIYQIDTDSNNTYHSKITIYYYKTIK